MRFAQSVTFTCSTKLKSAKNVDDKMNIQEEVQRKREAVLARIARPEDSEWVLKWQEIESDMMYNVPWNKLYERVGLKKTSSGPSLGRWTIAEGKFWAEYLRFVTEVYHYGDTLEELKRRITDQRIYNSRTYKRRRF